MVGDTIVDLQRSFQVFTGRWRLPLTNVSRVYFSMNILLNFISKFRSYKSVFEYAVAVCRSGKREVRPHVRRLRHGGETDAVRQESGACLKVNPDACRKPRRFTDRLAVFRGMSEAQKAAEESARIRRMEDERVRRMLGRKSAGSTEHRSADDLNDEWVWFGCRYWRCAPRSSCRMCRLLTDCCRWFRYLAAPNLNLA